MSAPCPTCKPQENKCGANASCDERGELVTNSCVCFRSLRPANVDDGYRLFVQDANEYIVIVAEGVPCDVECTNQEPGDYCDEVPDVPGQCTGGVVSSTSSTTPSNSVFTPSITTTTITTTITSATDITTQTTVETESPHTETNTRTETTTVTSSDSTFIETLTTTETETTPATTETLTTTRTSDAATTETLTFTEIETPPSATETTTSTAAPTDLSGSGLDIIVPSSSYDPPQTREPAPPFQTSQTASIYVTSSNGTRSFDPVPVTDDGNNFDGQGNASGYNGFSTTIGSGSGGLPTGNLYSDEDHSAIIQDGTTFICNSEACTAMGGSHLPTNCLGVNPGNVTALGYGASAGLAGAKTMEAHLGGGGAGTDGAGTYAMIPATATTLTAGASLLPTSAIRVMVIAGALLVTLVHI